METMQGQTFAITNGTYAWWHRIFSCYMTSHIQNATYKTIAIICIEHATVLWANNVHVTSGWRRALLFMIDKLSFFKKLQNSDQLNMFSLPALELPQINYGAYNGRKYSAVYGVSSGFLLNTSVRFCPVDKWAYILFAMLTTSARLYLLTYYFNLPPL